MRNINIDFYNSGNTIILGYTNEHLATNLNFVVPAEFRDGYSYKLIFNLENNQEYMELFASYPITYKVSNIIMSAGTSGHLQLSVLKKQDNGEVMVAQSGIIPFKVLSSLADNNTEIGEYTNTIETLIAEFVSNLQNINSRELKANKIVTTEQITDKEENYPSIQYLEDNYPTNNDVYLVDEADNKFLASDHEKIVLTKHLGDGVVTTEKIAPLSVGSTELKIGAVTTDKIENKSITTEKIADNAVTADKIGLQAVTFNKIAENAVLNKHIANGSVKESKIADGAVTESKIANLSITTEKIADNAVTTKAILDGTVTTEKIADEAVISGKIKDESIIESKIANEAVTNEKLATSSVTTDKIKKGSVTGAKLASDAVTENVLHKDLKEKINQVNSKPNYEQKTNCTLTPIENTTAKSGTFSYARIGDFVFVNAQIVFQALPDTATNKTAKFVGLPFTTQTNYNSGHNIFRTESNSAGKCYFRWNQIVLSLDSGKEPTEDETTNISFFYMIQ